MKMYTLGQPTLLAAAVALLDFLPGSFCVRLSLSPVAYDYNQSLSPTYDNDWELVGNVAPFEDPSSFSESSPTEIKEKEGLQGRDLLANRALKPLGSPSSNSRDSEEIAEGSLAQLQQNTGATPDLDKYSDLQASENGEANSKGGFLQFDRLRKWWRQKREQRARANEADRLREREQERKRKRRRERRKARGGQVTESDWEGSEGEK